MSDVLIVKCPNYTQENVDKAVARVFKDIPIKIKPKSKVLIKPNILMAKKPEYACSTHHAMIEAVCKILAKNKCQIIIGESSGFNTMNGFTVSGIKAVAEKYNAKIIAFENDKISDRKINGIILKELKITSLIDDVDYIINMPKMKTHMLMRITGAVKNCYGFIPGFQKAIYHTKGKDENQFGELLIDIYTQCKDKIAINIMDAIVGMEGEGPGNGDPKNTGLIIASTDALALDVTQSKIMGFDPIKIQTIRAAVDRKLLNISDIKVIGDYKNSNIPQFNYTPAGAKGGNKIVKFITTAKSYLMKKPILIPEVNKDKCIKCGICAKLCPVQCIKLKPYPAFDRNICIKCYCCHEHCPQGAIFLKR
jgi:uncharacterized protein (DUF362 family)/NAD-dependent dihydropyrimidine dehydrogenase PreA subunit